MKYLLIILLGCTAPQERSPESLSNDMKAVQYEKTIEIIQAAGDIHRGMVQDSMENHE